MTGWRKLNGWHLCQGSPVCVVPRQGHRLPESHSLKPPNHGNVCHTFPELCEIGLNQAMNVEAGLEDNLPPPSQSITLSAYMNKGVYKLVPLKPRAGRQYQDETQAEREERETQLWLQTSRNNADLPDSRSRTSSSNMAMDHTPLTSLKLWLPG